jgi:steroid delta-isomerase-like uncharacterized protein
MTIETNKAAVRRLHELWNSGDVASIPEIFHPDFAGHWPPSSRKPERRGLDEVRAGLLSTRTAFPDWHEHVVDMVAEGDRVVTRYVSTGTHRGDFWGLPPTGVRVTVHEMSIYRIAAGKVIEQWCSIDELERLIQLGAVPRRPGP